jgi:translation elongation factor EF-G
LRARRAILTTSEKDEWSSIQSSKGSGGSESGGHSLSSSSSGLSGSLRSIQVQAYLPVSESFGFSELLRKNTSGEAFPTMTFSHWQIMKGNLYNDEDEPAELGSSSTSGGSKGGNAALETVIAIRTRKGLTPYLPPLADFHDKL